MGNDAFRTALKIAEGELGQLLNQREETEKRITALVDVIEGLRLLCGDSAQSFQAEIKNQGLTDAVRRILEFSNSILSPTQIRSILVAARYDLSGQSNVMATLHSILRRLEEAGEVVADKGDDGTTVYLWLSPLRRALLKDVEDRRKYLEESFLEPSKKFGGPPFASQRSTVRLSDLHIAPPPGYEPTSRTLTPPPSLDDLKAPEAPDLSDLKGKK